MPLRTVRMTLTIAVTALSFCLSGCLIPDDFELEISVPSVTEAAWNYSGKWQFFFVGYDPRKDVIPPEGLAKITAAIAEIPGSISVDHIEKNIWTQTIKRQIRLQDANGQQPVAVLFPSGVEQSGGVQRWFVRISPAAGNAVIVEAVDPPREPDRAAFQELGYKAQGVIRIRTTGKVEQLSGPALSKSWFGNSYSSKVDLFQDQALKVRITW